MLVMLQGLESYLKSMVYRTTPTTSAEKADAIRETVVGIHPDMSEMTGPVI